MSFYLIVKTTYKTVLPNAVRVAIFRNMPESLKMMRAYLIRELGKYAKHDELYDEKYYEGFLVPSIAKSYEVIAESIVRSFSPKSTVDVGCGRGQLLLELKKRGVVCRGLELSSIALKICRYNGLDVIKFDIELDKLPKDVKADVVVSTEVAEHLPERCSDRFVGILCAIADNIVMTAAEPARTWEEMKRGHDHVNEQPKEYWIDKFVDKGFKYCEDISTQFRREWKEREVSPWFLPGLMIFQKERDSSL
jgi:SAM-dependent methyltransferase